MNPDTVEADPVMLEFLGRVYSDLAGNGLRPIVDYLRLYPGRDDQIADQYDRIRDGRDGTLVVTMVGVASGGEERRGTTDIRVGDPGHRYRLGRRIGAGAMGEVFRARDLSLGREVAIKFARTSLFNTADRETDLIQEALTAARLSHSSIPPIHDIGVDPEGRPFYVMLRIAGRSLRQVLAERRDHPRKWSLTRLLMLFVQVCSAVEHAHSRGVLHLDLKPENIMVGSSRELYVVDWGLARNYRTAQDRGKGRIAGTPLYMSPEQARGDMALSSQSDVYSLALLLREIVVGCPAYGNARGAELLRRVRDGVIESGSWSDLPRELRGICQAATVVSPDKRTSSARDLASAVQEFLDGAHDRKLRQEAAREMSRGARATLRERGRLLRQLKQLDRRIDDERPDAWLPASKKRRFWKLEDERETVAAEGERTFERASQQLQEAHGYDPESVPIRRQLARVLWERFEAAEENGDLFQSRYYRERIQTLRLPEYARALVGDGSLHVVVSPAAKQATLYRWAERERRLRRVKLRELNPRRIRVDTLEMGRYQLVLARPGFRTLALPIHVSRSEQVGLKLRLYSEEELAPDFLLIPGGRFIMGGDSATMKSVARCRPHVPDFAMARFPVTFSEYVDFLSDLPPRSAEARVPRLAKGGAPFEFVELFPRVRLSSSSKYRDRARWPVFGVSWHDANAYARWRSLRDGRSYRLPSDREWEKAARGTDGRVFPWGDRFDDSFCKGNSATPEKSQPQAVGKYRADESPYGVRDLAGGVREWCRSWYSQRDQQQLIRGGCWNQPNSQSSHGAYRNGCARSLVYPWLGFRLVQPLS